MNVKVLIGGGVMAIALVALIVSAVQSSAQYAYSVEEVLARQAALANAQTNLRVSGFVIGDSIQYDSKDLTLSFDIVSTHQELADPQQVLHVVANGHPRPDLLKHEVQANLTGRLGADGAFYVASGGDALMLNCPTRYEEAASTPASDTPSTLAPTLP